MMWLRTILLSAIFIASCPSIQLALAEEGSKYKVAPEVETILIGSPFEIKLSGDARDVVIGDPTLLDATITTGRVLVLTGKAPGLTTITISDRNGASLMTLAIRVNTNLTDLIDIIHNDFGIDTVQVRALRSTVIVSGVVPSASDADKILDLVRSYMANGNSAEAEERNTIRLVNTLKIRDREQVMLRVVISEVQRSLLKQLGVDTQGSWSVGDFSLNNSVTFPTTRTPTTSFMPGIAGSSANKGSATLKALERAGYLKTLAEPTLTAISGESAKFTAGGEIPVPTGDICSTNAIGIQSCQTNYGYKPIGVTLSFTPIVLNFGRISLHVTTEVTEIDNDNGSRTSSANIPAFRSRKMDTTVELASGAALMSAGLIQQQSSSTYDRVPGIATIPILGKLFQSNDYQNHQTELLISVVPYIAKANGPLEPNHADDEFGPSYNQNKEIIAEISRLYRVRPAIPQPRIGFEVR